MMNQYNPQRFRRAIIGGKSVNVGTIPVGSIIYIQDNAGPFGIRGPIIRREPWLVEAWLNRTVGAARRNTSGKYEPSIMLGGHLAVVRGLRTGRRQLVADWLLLLSEESQ